MKHKTLFNFKWISIRYDLPNQADVYFLTEDNTYNKQVNDLMLDWWYKRIWLHKSDPLVELEIWEYKRHWVYVRDDEDYLANHDIREKIREIPFLLGNDTNGD
jgi:hypothetical protein